jgi:hypothetical protein
VVLSVEAVPTDDLSWNDPLVHRAGARTPAAGVAAAGIFVILGIAGAFVRGHGGRHA